MSKRKFAVPGTYIVGSSPQLDAKGDAIVGVKMPLMTAAGKPVGSRVIRATPLFNMPNPLGTQPHWRTEAARRRWNGDFEAAYKDPKGKNDIIVVPLYRGVAARIANQFRGQQRRARRKSILAQIKERITARMQGAQETPA